MAAFRRKQGHGNGKIKKKGKSRRNVLVDAADFMSIGIKSLLRDDFTKCFKPITKNELNGSGIFYIFSLFIRYIILLPLRILLFLIGSSLFAIALIYIFITKNNTKTEKIYLFYVNVFIFCFGASIKHHGNKYRLNEPHIFVANHTSFLDFLVLSSHKFCHASVAQSHGGLFGFLYKKVLSKNGSLLFERSEKSDRNNVLNRIKEHVGSDKPSMLMFPEGTCVNNKYSVLYQRGAFQLDAAVFPVAILYRKKLLDPYWNTSKHTFFVHLLYLMSRWKLDVEVFWMDPVWQYENETSSDFAMRVKKLISNRIGLKDVLWNGYFKSAPALKDRNLLCEAFKNVYSDHCIFEEYKTRANYKPEIAMSVYKGTDIDTPDYVDLDGTDYVFHNFKYDDYLQASLRRYLRYKDHPEEVEKINALKAEAKTCNTEDIYALDVDDDDIIGPFCTCYIQEKPKGGVLDQ